MENSECFKAEFVEDIVMDPIELERLSEFSQLLVQVLSDM
jgi:hypothetical protein